LRSFLYSSIYFKKEFSSSLENNIDHTNIFIILLDGDFFMPKYKQYDEQVSDGVNLLISILVRYPEIGRIGFDPQSNSLKLTFLLSTIPSNLDFSNIKNVLLNSLIAYTTLEDVSLSTFDVQLDTYDQVAMLSIYRDVHTISKGEIALLIALLRGKFKNHLITDFNDSLLEEDLLIQEEVIEDMLTNIKKHHTENRLIGIREDGRVLVFNK